jgi:hypothetical protein
MSEIILVILGIGIISYIGGSYFAQKEANKKRVDKIDSAKKVFIKAKTETKNAKDELISAITKYYSKVEADKVSNNEIWIGMESDLIVASWGKANEIKDSYVGGKRIEKWYYNPYYNRLNNLKYKFEITIENNHIQGWKDLV